MKKFLPAAVSLVAMAVAVAASAADLPARPPYTKAPPPVAAIYDWTGFYVGANGGWGGNRNCWDFVRPTGAVVPGGCHSGSGGLAGGQLGYRWQAGQFVFGVEGQGDWADLKSTHLSPVKPAFSTRATVDGVGLITGQVGYAFNSALLYLKGGAAVTGNRFDILTAPAGVTVAAASSTRWGGAIGTGFEYGFAPNWSAGVEYDHLFMGRTNTSFAVANPIVPGATNRISDDVDMVTLRLNYRFGLGGFGGFGPPLATRY